MTTFGRGEGNVSIILYLTSEMYVHVERGDIVPVARYGGVIDEAVESTGLTSSCTGTTSSEYQEAMNIARS